VSTSLTSNPFLAPSPLPFELPNFAAVRVEHFREAFEAGMAEQTAELEAIVGSSASPTFENTVVALERSGRTLDRASRVFSLLTSADTTPELQAIEVEYAPLFAAFADQRLLDRRLFARLDAVHASRATSGLDAEALRLVERYHLDFVRAGAALGREEQARLKELNAQLAVASTRFGLNLRADTNEAAVLVSDVAELAGLSEDAVAAAAAAAADRGLQGYLLTLILPTHQPALERLRNRTVRRRLWAASAGRGARGNEHDNRALVLTLVRLRAERAELLGHRTHSDYVLADRTAESNDRLDAMLEQLVGPSVRMAGRERDELAAAMLADTGEDDFSAWDWAYYADRRKRELFAFDTGTLRPWFEVERVLVDGVFHAAERLYGITFTRRPDLVGYHPDCAVYEVSDVDGAPLGLFVADYFTRDSKRGGAWMASAIVQSGLLGQRPVVVNNMNLPKPPPGSPALMGFDEVGTMFHEFGHALHGLFSAVTYPRLAGTAVSRDFVEYPSQVNEVWMTWPSVLEGYARHVETGEPLAAEVLERVEAAETDAQGYTSVAYLAATCIDLAWHRLTSSEAAALGTDLDAFEAAALTAAGLDLPEVTPRYRSAYFNHIFAGGYSAGYYSYIWSEVLDADTVAWFREHGGLVRESGDRFRRSLLSRGGTQPEMDCVTAFLGRAPDITPLLRRRGLVA
jgi:peptidyl-dipeptidase Dcp